MQLKNIRVQNFRNHTDSIFEFGERANILLGDNGQGKTNILEAISYLCLTKSFYSHGDYYAIKIGKDIFEVEGIFETQRTGEQKVRVAYSEEKKEKLYTINKHYIEPLSSVIGKFPVVVCSPEHSPITNQGPIERRRFIDLVISQSSQVYFQKLIEYRKILRNRNKILHDSKIFKTDPKNLLEPWNEQLINAGSYIIIRRKKFVQEFRDIIESTYQKLVLDGEIPMIEYKPAIKIENDFIEKNVSEAIEIELNRRAEREKLIGTSLTGPHRDELLFTINGLDLRKYASQGQHKTFLVALKIAEFLYLRDQCNETPILLLDDIFSELDSTRASKLLDFVGTISQTFITSTNNNLFNQSNTYAGQQKIFMIDDGAVVNYESADK